MTYDIQVDFSQPSFQADPHPLYAELRRSSPVRLVQLPGGQNAWLVTRYDDARRALADPRLSKVERERLSPLSALPANIRAAISRHMLSADPPDHTRLRRLVSKAFTARRIEALRPRIQEITDGLLDAMVGRDRVDLLDAFAFPLPIQVICELGVPTADRDSFRAWSNLIVAGSVSADQLPGAVLSMVAYLRGLIDQRRGHGGDDLLAGLLEAGDDGDQLSADELSSMVFLLLVAGHETTVNLLGNGVYLLLSRPERWQELRADPALLPTAIEELLRYESPVEMSTFRFTTQDVEIGGQLIPADQLVMVGLLSANRDGSRFPDADELRLDRTHNPHLAFGHGIHFCLGAPLARLEAQVALGTLLARFPDLRLAGPASELTWRAGVLMRGLHELPVVPGPVRAA